MTQTILPPVKPADPSKEVQLLELVARYNGARGIMIEAVGFLGAKAEGLLDKLPAGVRTRIEGATYQALESSFYAAAASRKTLPDTGSWATPLITATTGAVGGFGGLTTALAELPVTTTLILRAIQGIAVEHGFDPDDPDTKADCLRVLAAAGPLAEDDGTDLSFLTLRTSVSGATVQALLAKVAPKLSVTLSQKLAAQTVPVLGAAAGATINYAFTSYYQDIAHVQFGLRKLAEDTGHDRAALVQDFEALLRDA